MRTSKKEKLFGTLLLLPAAIIVFGVYLYPLTAALIESFKKMNLLLPNPNSFVGLANYVSVLHDNRFWSSLERTTYFSAITVPTEIILAIGIATVLNQKFKARGFVRGLIIFPWALPTVVNGVMWQWIFNTSEGAFNALLSQVGIINNYVNWLGAPWRAMNCLILADIWKETSFATILTLVALQNIPKELYEAAKIDGAGPWQRFTYITIPMIRPIIIILLILKTIWAIQQFDLVSVVTMGGPANGTTTISYYIWTLTFGFLQFGKGSAMAYILLAITAVLAFSYIRRMNVKRG